MLSLIWAGISSLPFATALIGQYVPNLAIDHRSLVELYKAVQKENGPLQVVSGGDAWEARFPAVPLNLTIDASKYLDNRIDRDFYENRSGVDVPVLQSLQDYQRWKEESRLLYYKPRNFEDLLEGEKDFQGAFLPVQIVSFGSFFHDNSKLDQPLPTSFEELAGPAWRGKLILTCDDAIGYLFSLIVSRYGTRWFKALASNDVQWTHGTSTSLHEFMDHHNDASYKRCLTFISKGTGDPLPSYIESAPPKYPEQIMSFAKQSAILSSTLRPESARLFQAFLASPQWQDLASASGPSTLRSLNLAKGTSPYSSNITQISGYRQWSFNRAQVEWFRFLYEDVLGTSKGPDPIVRFPNPPLPL